MAILRDSDSKTILTNIHSGILPSVLKLTPEWLVISKPPGWLSIPGRHSEENVGVVLDWAKSQYGQVWTVHRLDRETSGVILFARTAEAHALANDWFENRKTRKKYLCLALGQAAQPVFKLNTPIEGKRCLTQVEVLEQFSNAFLGRVSPVTGRRHQIRIHLSEVGHPILGDPRYGGLTELPPDSWKVNRVALHAFSLELPTGEIFEAPLPEDFESWLGILRKETR